MIKKNIVEYAIVENNQLISRVLIKVKQIIVSKTAVSLDIE